MPKKPQTSFGRSLMNDKKKKWKKPTAMPEVLFSHRRI